MNPVNKSMDKFPEAERRAIKGASQSASLGENPSRLAHVRGVNASGTQSPPADGLASMNRITPDQVREFLLAKYVSPIRELGLDSATVGDDFDFLLRGVVDSFGILTMISSIEDEFDILLDMERLDAEQITILGPLSRYVAEQSRRDDHRVTASLDLPDSSS